MKYNEAQLKKYKSRISNEDLLYDLRKLAKELGTESVTKAAYIEKGRYSNETIRKRFGSWNVALVAAGLTLNRHYNVSDKEYIDDLRRVARELKRKYITSVEYIKRGKYSMQPLCKRFGSWNQAVKIAGLLTIEEYRYFSDSEFIDDYKKVAKRLKRENTTSKEYHRQGRYPLSALKKRFGSWNKAQENAGVVVKFHNYIDSQELIDDLKEVARKLGKNNVPRRAYDRLGKYNFLTIAERFGSWNKALETAGFTTNNYEKISKEALFENMKQVWKNLGRQPYIADMKFPLSKYNKSTYLRNFGTWRNALTEFKKMSR